MDVISNVTKIMNELSIRGRTSRKSYLVFFSASTIVTIILISLLPETDKSFFLLSFWLPIYWISAPFIITIRRFHDVGRSGKSVLITTIILIVLFVVICLFLCVLVGVANAGGRTTFPVWFFPLFISSLLAFIGVVGRNTLICLLPGEKEANAYGLPPK